VRRHDVRHRGDRESRHRNDGHLEGDHAMTVRSFHHFVLQLPSEFRRGRV
jgi:hypothetical protein